MNPILIFDISKIKDGDSLSRVVLRKEENIATSKIDEIVKRFRLVFSSIDFSENDAQALLDVYQIRNYFIHGYKPDNEIYFDQEDLMSKMGTIWEKVSNLATGLFDKEVIKKNTPKKKYTEQELEQVLESEVREMIKPIESEIGVLNTRSAYEPISLYSSGDECPRCGSYRFSLNNNENDWWTRETIDTVFTGFSPKSGSTLYKCKKCNLELTEKQYAIAKRIRDSQSI